ncbi:rhomboid family intramembrane serine protease [Rhodovulum viride]|uniref:Rhomboid family intramembrane serine protease n=1 Tax=Rhodovulum viride TaxID=1231134 RepID=A0ABX9DFK2_9RHOB|nr:rhomboid family intramembrane serine protease [Rhodovulum viride]RAP40161.1 rhomboid family intramembrane serine protease [Rhodovulum viride]
MFPLRDHNPSSRFPIVTLALIGVNVAVFLSYLPLFSDPRAVNAFFQTWGMVPALMSQSGDWTGLLTSMFLHGGVLHLAGNMLFLWIFGDNMEDRFGHLGFLLFYLAGGVAAALFQYVIDPGSPVPVVGASGAIAAVMGGYLLLFPKARVDILIILVVIFRVIPVPAWLMLGLWFGLQLYSGVSAPTGEGGVAYWAHSGGFLAGLALTLPLWLRLGGPEFWGRNSGSPPHPVAVYSATSIPRVRRRR